MNPATFNIAVLQYNFSVGEISGNARILLQAYREAVGRGATLVLAPELALSGYPPKDFLLHKAFIAACMEAVHQVATEVGEVPLAFGTPWEALKRGDYGQKSHNSYVVAQRGKLVFRTDKTYPAQGGVFDEWRVHLPGKAKLWSYKGLKIGFPICEDIWHDKVVDRLVKRGATMLLVPNGSPTYVGKPKVRHQLVERHTARTNVPMLYFNHVGGQDEHAFDGGAFFANPEQPAIVFAPYWQEQLAMVAVVRNGQKPEFQLVKGQSAVQTPMDIDYMLDGIVLTTRDYLLKSSSIRKVVVGVSGGVDSAVVLGLAVLVMKSAGLNPADHIIAVSMPSKHNTSTTQSYAQQVCDNLGVKLHWWPIQSAIESLTSTYESVFGHALKQPGNAAYENTQSRERGQILMVIANRQHAMLLSTGNKSEMAMGYATLYGDMNGGFNPLKTVYKMDVYRLGHAINAKLGDEAIPHALIHQKPSAELDDNQFDENSLPPYPVLDAILTRLMDERLDVAELMALEDRDGLQVRFVPAASIDKRQRQILDQKPPFQRWWTTSFDRYGSDGPLVYYITQDCVLAVAQKLRSMRFKRYQAPPGVTVTASSFDDGEKYPIAGGLAWLAQWLE
jgi:NAD+ synthase